MVGDDGAWTSGAGSPRGTPASQQPSLRARVGDGLGDGHAGTFLTWERRPHRHRAPRPDPRKSPDDGPRGVRPANDSTASRPSFAPRREGATPACRKSRLIFSVRMILPQRAERQPPSETTGEVLTANAQWLLKILLFRQAPSRWWAWPRPASTSVKDLAVASQIPKPRLHADRTHPAPRMGHVRTRRRSTAGES